MLGKFAKMAIQVVKIWIKLRARDKVRKLYDPCEKQPLKLCPHTRWVGKQGGMHSNGYNHCCKHIEQRIAMSKAIAQLLADVNYNGASYTQGVIDSCRREAKLPIPKGPLINVMDAYDD